MSDPNLLSSAKLVERLQQIRAETRREPGEVLKYSEVLLKRKTLDSGDDEVWTVREQVAVAALELGQINLAEECADLLAKRFPGSPRVAILVGQIMEARGLTDEARQCYEDILRKDESDIAARKRLIALHLAAPASSSTALTTKGKGTKCASSAALSKETGIDLLVEYLDTFYSDAEGWSQLAAAYAELGLYAQSLSALSHLILLLPHNPYHLLHHAETAYTMGDYNLAYMEFLRVIEMSDGVVAVGGAGRRAAVGVKLCVQRLRASSAKPADPLLEPQELDKVDLLATKLILKAYLHPEAVGAGIVRKWVGGQ